MEPKKFAHSLVEQSIRIEDGHECSGIELAEYLQAILSLEVEEGGPYALPDTLLKDIGLNLAIYRFLKACGIELPNLNAFLGTNITSSSECSSVFSSQELDVLKEFYNILQIKEEVSDSVYALDEKEASMLSLIRKTALKRFKNLPIEFQERSINLVERTLGWNTDKQMSLMSYYVRLSMGTQGNIYNDEYIAELGLSNIFFWSAFIVYDDFWDLDEAADPKLLPVANLFARHYVTYFSSRYPEHAGFQKFFQDGMDKLDAANGWETQVCRMSVIDGIVTLPDELPVYGDFTIKFYPAIGHIMGPVLMLIEKGLEIESNEMKSFISFFKHYLVAMQMNDDAHDWKEDLQRGHISTVVSEILKKWKEKHSNTKEINLELDMAELEQLFWYEVLSPFCLKILEHISESRKYLQSLNFLEDLAPLERFIIRNEKVAQEALAEQKRTIDFIKAMKFS